MAALSDRWNAWFHAPVPLERWHVFRVLIYLYVPLDVATSKWVAHHGLVPASWYEPLFFARVLDIPAPTASAMAVTGIALLTLPFVAVLGKGRRVLGPLIAVLYFFWCFVAMTYGKVDHDRVALLTALAVLPTVPWRGRGATGPDAERAGWALSITQVAFALTYFLAGATKLLVSGFGWVTLTTLERAITRRGTMFGDVLMRIPWVLVPMQFAILVWELLSPLMLMRNRLGKLYVYSAIAFHVVSLIGITIYFRSHLVAVIAFLPLERLYRRRRSGDGIALQRADIVHTE